jgi:O-antigen ligase
VLVTFGRNSIIAWVWVACLLAAAGTVPRVGIVLLGAVALSAAMFASLLADYVSGRPELVEAANDIVARLSFFTTGQATDDSAGMRLLVAEAGIQMFLDQPLFGAGAGATHFWSLPVSPHNQPVMLAAEYGVAGLVLWGWLMVQLWRGAFFAERPLQIAGALLAVYFSFFSHNLFDFVYWLISFALLSSRQAEATSAR